MNISFEYTTALQYRVKSLSQQLKDFESGEKYVKMKTGSNRIVDSLNKTIASLKSQLAEAHKETARVREYWFEVFEDINKEHEKELKERDNIIEKQKKRILEVERQRDDIKDRFHERTLELYGVQTELEDEKGKNKKLTAQVNRDFENSSIPSSAQIGRKKIINSREKTDKKPGGQPGHEGHHRKQHIPTKHIEIPTPEKYLNNIEYKETGKTICKQKVILNISLEVIEYSTKEYRDLKTGQRVHAEFPEGCNNDVNYDGSVKALAFLLGNECNVSHDKIKRLLSELTSGELELSIGMINGVSKEFSKKTEAERKEIYNTLLSSPVMNIDFTNASVDGESAQVLICATPGTTNALFIARRHKGHKGIEGTPVEHYQGTLVHDHDTTFYGYGLYHQECMQHNTRYIKGSEENEPELTWNTKMGVLVREMLHYRNSLAEDEELDMQRVAELEKEYDKILETAREEYEYEPPSDYYREGYNLYRRLLEYKTNELLFLHDKRVPSNNSLCERLARVYKRKQKQVMTLRSYDNFSYLCDSLSVVYLLRGQVANLYDKVSNIFNRILPIKKKTTDSQ